jgi:hypothetical protein
MGQQVSDLIVERLIAWGVDTIFGFPSDGVDGFFESLRRSFSRQSSSRKFRQRSLLPRASPGIRGASIGLAVQLLLRSSGKSSFPGYWTFISVEPGTNRNRFRTSHVTRTPQTTSMNMFPAYIAPAASSTIARSAPAQKFTYPCIANGLLWARSLL